MDLARMGNQEDSVRYANRTRKDRFRVPLEHFSMSRRNFPLVRRQSLARHPSSWLLAAQLLSLVLYAAFDGVPNGRVLLSAFGVVVLVPAVWVVNRSPAINWIAWLLAAPAAVLSLLGLFLSPTLLVWAALFEAA
jgi:hypothetical protein